MATVADICRSALEDLGILGAGETAESGDVDVCFRALNQLIDQYAAERLMIYTTTRTTWTITSGDGIYTVGATGNVVIPRPVYPQQVHFIDTSQTPDLELPLRPLTQQEWADTNLKDLTSTYPLSWWYNPTYALGTLYLWPVPTSSTLLGAFYAPQQVTQFAASTDTVTLPPGYERLLVKNLAMDVAAKFGAVPSPAIIQAAREATNVVKTANRQEMELVSAYPTGPGRRSGYYNFLAGL